MIKTAAIVFCAGCALTVAFHLAMIAGAPWGHLTMGGNWPGVLPPQVRLMSAFSAALLGAMAYCVLSFAGMTRWTPPRWLKFGLLAYMALAVAVHVATPSAAERALWLPVIVTMTLALSIVVFAQKSGR